MTFFKTNRTKDYEISKSVNNVHDDEKKTRKPKIKSQSKDNLINDVRHLSTLKESDTIKGRTVRKIFEQQQQQHDYYQ